jgi:hypothetical protein
MKSKSGFSGIYPMVFALFDAKGDLSREAMRRQVKALLASKVYGMAISAWQPRSTSSRPSSAGRRWIGLRKTSAAPFRLLSQSRNRAFKDRSIS